MYWKKRITVDQTSWIKILDSMVDRHIYDQLIGAVALPWVGYPAWRSRPGQCRHPRPGCSAHDRRDTQPSQQNELIQYLSSLSDLTNQKFDPAGNTPFQITFKRKNDHLCQCRGCNRFQLRTAILFYTLNLYTKRYYFFTVACTALKPDLRNGLSPEATFSVL